MTGPPVTSFEIRETFRQPQNKARWKFDQASADCWASRQY